MSWTGQEIVTATAAAASEAAVASTAIERVSTDSRRIAPGTLFIALRGPRHDGHAFATATLRAGAVAVMVDHVPPGVDPSRAFVVRDTLRALGDLAAYTRHRWTGPVAALTGSNGKTTTKEMLAAILERFRFLPRERRRERGRLGGGHRDNSVANRRRDAGNTGAGTKSNHILKTHANENNLVGLPLTLLRLDGSESAAVLEMGMNASGEIARMTEIADPDVGVITNVGPAHLEGLGSIAGVAAAKGELFTGMRGDATIAVNMDDPWVVRAADHFRGRRVEFGCGRHVDASDITLHGFDDIAFTLHIGAETAAVTLPMPGRHNVQNALAAAAAAHALGVDIATVAAGLVAAESPKMRLQVMRLANGVTVVNDAYNANPASTEAALDTVARSAGRPIAVLGEMRELGAASDALHRRVGAHAAHAGIRWLLAVGPGAEAIASGARAAGSDIEVSVCENAAAAAALLIERWQPGDVIVVKGSRGADDEDGVRRYGARMAEVAARLEAAGGRA